MHKAYLATMIGAAISTSLASRLFAVGAFGPAKGRLLAHATEVSRAFSVRLRNFVDLRIAGMIAELERRASIRALHRMNDRELSDIGISRSSIGRIGRGLERERQPPAKETPTLSDMRARLL